MGGNPTHAVLFDVDGTLVDSTYLHTLAWWLSFRQAGHTVPMARLHRSIGMGGDKLVAHAFGREVDQEEEQGLKDAHDAIFSTCWPHLVRFEGARELLARCHAAGAAVVLASSAKEAELDVLRKALDADAWITAATSSSDAAESKPAPDIVEAALEAAGVDAAHALFVGDAVWDVQACGRLSMPVVGVRSGGTSAAELRDAGAVETYAHVADLLHQLDGSALGNLLDEVRSAAASGSPQERTTG
ncbi:HAD family hydrolase [Micrococcaceae bacterium RIT802]|nr:HAD family hydrolase [Micrococcaceae bacterium RIT 802]